MRALLDSGVWFRRFQSLPLSPQLRRTLAAVTEWHLSAYSVLEILHKMAVRPVAGQESRPVA